MLYGEKICIVKNIQKGSSEWKKIESNMKLTMQAANIEKIERI
jgi:hypothetical protein